MKKAQDLKRKLNKKSRWTSLAIVILAAILLETIAAIQYYYTRRMLERNLEDKVLITLRASAMRMDGYLNASVSQALNQTWHAEQHLNNPAYIETMVRNLVKDEGSKVVGAAVAFRPYYFAQKGRWYEPYAHREGSTVRLEQIGSENHDYEKQAFYQAGIKGDTMKWSVPYKDNDGARGEVTTYALPLRDATGQPVAVLGLDITTEWINKSMSDIRLHPSSFTMVLTEEGSIITAPTDSLCSPVLAAQIASMLVDPSVKKEERANGGVTCFYFYDEQQKRPGRVYYARKKFEPKWVLAKVVYDDEAFGELTDMRRNILWMTLAGLLVLGLIIHLFARNGRKLHNTLLQQQHIDQELQMANGIQQALLPKNEPTLQGVDEVEVEGCLIPALEVGGDLYNNFVRDGKLYFCIGDVSGKGVPSAIIMAIMQALFYNIASQESHPAKIMEQLNTTACRNNTSNMFVTLFIGVLDLQTGHLDYCNAGHECPLLNGQPLEVAANMPIGLFDDFAYEKQETTLTPGDLLFLYTDGLTEARNARQELFGRDSVVKMVSSCAGMAPKEMVSTIVSEVKRYAERTKQSDDLTLLSIRYNPKKIQQF